MGKRREEDQVLRVDTTMKVGSELPASLAVASSPQGLAV